MRDAVIAMVRLQHKIGISLVFLTLFIAGSSLVPVSTAGSFHVSQVDVTPPNIWDWNYTGRPNESEAFSVWANVTDNDGGVGIRNVTINISGPNVTIHDAMVNNGTFYEADIDAFPNPGTFDMYVSAYDLNNNTRYGRHIDIVIEADTEEPPDPILTLPIVVGSSGVLAVIVIMSALMFDRRQEELVDRTPSEDLT
jgi:hypothetical protein